MFDLENTLSLTKENVLGKVSEEDIFAYYIRSFTELGKPFCSELREDSKPSCSVYYSVSANRVLYRDFAKNLNIDCFSYIQLKYKCTFVEALNIINNDLNLKLGFRAKRIENMMPIMPIRESSAPKEKQYSRIEVGIREWNDSSDKEYWEQYGITAKTLNQFGVFPLTWFAINEICIYESRDGSNPIYGYHFGGGKWKIYRPKSVSKWFGNCSNDIVQGYKQLPEEGRLLIITKSLKDVMALKVAGYDAIAPQSETSLLRKSLVEDLLKKWRYIVMLFDSDETGISQSELYYKLYKIPSISLPSNAKGKDYTDIVKNHGIDYAEKWLNKMISKHVGIHWQT